MGRSAKTHKRVHNKAASSHARTSLTAQTAVKESQTTAPSAPQIKRKNNLKAKAQQLTSVNKLGNSAKEKVLGDVDYVTLMLGGRRKAKEEATKMNVDHS